MSILEDTSQEDRSEEVSEKGKHRGGCPLPGRNAELLFQTQEGDPSTVMGEDPHGESWLSSHNRNPYAGGHASEAMRQWPVAQQQLPSWTLHQGPETHGSQSQPSQPQPQQEAGRGSSLEGAGRHTHMARKEGPGSRMNGTRPG